MCDTVCLHSFLFTHSACSVLSKVCMSVFIGREKLINSRAADVTRQETGLVNSLSGQLK